MQTPTTQIENRPATRAGCLRGTLGSLVEDPDARPLSAEQRSEMRSWRERRFIHLEGRFGERKLRDAERWYELLAFEGWRGEGEGRALPPAALKLFYLIKRWIPRRVQLALRRRLIKLQGEPEFPAWPYDPAGFDLLRLLVVDTMLELDVDSVRFPWFWPEGASAAVVLSHDVESAAGFDGAREVAGWEEVWGFRSSFNVVADWYPIDEGCLEDLRERGFEIGSHAIHHDRSLFSTREEFGRQLPLLCESAERFGAVGFRSPATHRVVEWLPEIPFSYDCTMPHSDPYEPIPGGTCTIWPFFHGDVVEIPYTAPQDHTLFNLLGHRDASLWRQQLDQIAAHGGLFQPITHPDPEYLGQPQTKAAYRELLAAIGAREDLWVALPREVAEWWRLRAAGETPRDNGVARWTPAGPALSVLESDG
jgi:peptidoglycan/xylan/chitin deacetylase (PgdA/CDA1 family)